MKEKRKSEEAMAIELAPETKIAAVKPGESISNFCGYQKQLTYRDLLK